MSVFEKGELGAMSSADAWIARSKTLELGRVVLEATGAEILASPHAQAAHLGRS